MFDDKEMFPLLDEAGRAMLRRLLEHPHAPKYNHQVGEQLSAEGLARVRRYAGDAAGTPRGWSYGRLPPWVRPFLERCRRDVPYYRSLSDWPGEFLSLPLLDRQQIRRQPWSFVPDSLPVEDLIVYTTSGTTGDRLHIPATPELPNRYLPLLERALRAYGVLLEGGPRVAIVQVSAQSRTVTNCSVISYLQGAGFAKINLNPVDWHDPADPVRFLDDCDAQLYTGDPFAFYKLMQLPLMTRPKALLSVGAQLLPGLRARLEQHFGCPVIDMYSLNESGPVAFSLPGEPGRYEILPHDLFVEVLDASGQPCPPGQRGRIVLTGGLNPMLPLVRYVTGDYAAMDYSAAIPCLVGLQGRAPTVFRAADGRCFSGIDVTTALRDFVLPYVHLHQRADGSLLLETHGEPATLDGVREALLNLFGRQVPIEVEVLAEPTLPGKPLAYTSDLHLPEDCA